MKVSIDIDCTPEEARAFFGLPNVEALNKAVMDQIQAQILEHMRTMDPETLYKTWFPAGTEAWEKAWGQFRDAFAAGAGGGRNTSDG